MLEFWFTMTLLVTASAAGGAAIALGVLWIAGACALMIVGLLFLLSQNVRAFEV